MGLSFAQWLASDAKRLHLDVRIEGIGTYLDNTDLAAADDDARYRFSPSQPTYASAQPAALWLPLLKKDALPDLMGESIDGVFGGIPDFSAITIHLADFSDALTLLFATEVAPVTVLNEDISANDLSFDVADASSISDDSLAFVGGEALRITGLAGTTVTVDRGYLDTDAVAHFAGDPVYLTSPYLVGRRLELRIAPLNGNDESDEREVFTGLIDGVAWDEIFKVWVLSATNVERYLDRIVPRAPDEFEVAGFTDTVEDDDGFGYVKLYNDSLFAIEDWIHWSTNNATDEFPEINFYAEIDGKEIVGGRVPNTASQTGIYISRRALFGTELVDIKDGMKIRRVFCSGDPLGHLPSSFRTLDPGDDSLELDPAIPTSHWVDLMLILITSPSEEHGLGALVAPNQDGVHRNYSTLPVGFGLGYPADLIDFDSFLDVKRRTIQYVFPGFILGAGAKQKSGTKLLSELFLEPMGAYLSTDSGRLRLYMPRTPLEDESIPAIDHSAWLLEKTEKNTYRPRVSGRIRTSEHVSSIKYEVGRSAREIVFLASDFTETAGLRGQYAGRSNDVTTKLEAGDEGLVDLYGARAQSRFLRQRRPRVELMGDCRLGSIYDSPSGSMVLVSLQRVPNLAQGVRDWDEVPADVQKREFKLPSDRDGLHAKIELLAHSPHFLAARVAPAAHVDSVTGDVATVLPNRYTASDAPTGLPSHDLDPFQVGDVVRLINPDGTSASGGTQVVVSVDTGTDELELDGDFGGDLASDTIIVVAAYADASARQQGSYAFEADRATQSIATGVRARTYGED